MTLKKRNYEADIAEGIRMLIDGKWFSMAIGMVEFFSALPRLAPNTKLDLVGPLSFGYFPINTSYSVGMVIPLKWFVSP